MKSLFDSMPASYSEDLRRRVIAAWLANVGSQCSVSFLYHPLTGLLP